MQAIAYDYKAVIIYRVRCRPEGGFAWACFTEKIMTVADLYDAVGKLLGRAR
jgi:hypothetical protein